MTALPPGLLVAYYGDDYTGSAAVMEVAQFAGLPAVLFLDTPTPERLAAFGACRVIGIAGVARSQDPGWMARALPPVFRALAALDAPIAHYKVCSTFDSAPEVGSIGAAIDLAVPDLGGDWHPLVVAAPALGRYQAFGNLFAVADGVGYRLDRHPTMARHPVTPMGEADVRRHLAEQTARPIGLVDWLALTAGRGGPALAEQRAAGAEIVALDVLDDRTLAEAGRLIWEQRGRRLLAIGSQGVEYALIAHWRAAGLLAAARPPRTAAAVPQLIAVSGSCSPVTALQIAEAEASGFVGLCVDAVHAIDPAAWEHELDRATAQALAALAGGRDPLLYTARGPDDPAVAALRRATEAAGLAPGVVNDRIGAGLGRLLDRLLRASGVRRAVVAGGDTSGHAVRQLGVYALTALAPLAPGAPLCRAHAADPAYAGLELVLKGGQGGAPAFFAQAKAGRV